MYLSWLHNIFGYEFCKRQRLPGKSAEPSGNGGHVLLTVTSPNNAPTWSPWEMPSTVCASGFGLVSDGTNLNCTPTILPVILRQTGSDATTSSTSFSTIAAFSFGMAASTSHTMNCDLFYEASAKPQLGVPKRLV
jgi:hypothetical protein